MHIDKIGLIGRKIKKNVSKFGRKILPPSMHMQVSHLIAIIIIIRMYVMTAPLRYFCNAIDDTSTYIFLIFQCFALISRNLFLIVLLL